MYETGHERVTIQAVTEIEQSSSNKGRTSIIVTEIPYQVNKSALLEKVANLVNEFFLKELQIYVMKVIVMMYASSLN